jgi:methionine-R-sulfoxide reductase
MAEFEVTKSDEEWRAQLGPQAYAVLRQAATEAPFSGSLLNVDAAGTYTCRGCGTVLFTSEQKFDSHCGWPSFDDEAGEIVKVSDHSLGMVRTEILCARCGGHLGHLFDDGPTATGLRYCVNSLSLGFEPAAADEEDAEA